MSESVDKSKSQLAIVGGGIAGLACANQLQAAGVSVTVFDKGRRPGGRMSTRSVDDKFSFDYGCQFFSADDPIFDRQVKSWLDSGVVSVWRGSVVQFTDGQVIEKSSTRLTSNVDLASTTNDCPNIMHPPGFKSRVPVAGYDCQGEGTYVTDSGDDDLNGVIIITIDDMPFLEFFDVDHGNAY